MKPGNFVMSAISILVLTAALYSLFYADFVGHVPYGLIGLALSACALLSTTIRD